LLLRLVKLVAPLGCVIEDNKPFFIGFLKCWKYQRTEPLNCWKVNSKFNWVN
jgi:hypothetical protein